MLYERWRKVAATRRDDLALYDIASGRRWTFAELFAAVMRARPSQAKWFFRRPFTRFVLDLVAGWREGKVACPIEAGQMPSQVSPPPSPCVHLKLTSATTGSARLVAFTADQLAADAENIVVTMGLRAQWPNLGVISLAHSYGFSNLVMPLLLHGIPLILAPSPLPEAVRRAAESINALTLPAVPAMWRAWHEADAIPSCVRLAISAAAPLPVKLEQGVFAAHGLKIHNFYGASECGGIAYDASQQPRDDDAFVGAPMINVALSVNENGCLVVESYAVDRPVGPNRRTLCARVGF